MQTIIHLKVCICHMHIDKWTRSFIFQLRLIFFAFVWTWNNFLPSKKVWYTSVEPAIKKILFPFEWNKTHLLRDKRCEPIRLQFHGTNESICRYFRHHGINEYCEISGNLKSTFSLWACVVCALARIANNTEI